MKAIVQNTYGSTDVLEFRDIDRPTPGDDEVLVRVRAAGVDAGVWHLMTGLPLLVRIMGYGLRAPSVPVRGRELAGVVESVGSRVTRFHPGDEVFGICEGAFAEYAVTSKVVAKPSGVSFEQAAATPISGLTALQALRGCSAGQRVLVIGAGGGVGTFAVQLAVAAGASVTGVCSTSKVDLVRSLGASVIDYRTSSITGRYDLILDTAGNRRLSVLRGLLSRSGTLVVIGGEEGGRWFGGIQRMLWAMLLSPFVRHKLRGMIASEGLDELEELRALLEVGTLVPVVDRTFSLGEAPSAIRYAQEGHARGKVVVTV